MFQAKTTVIYDTAAIMDLMSEVSESSSSLIASDDDSLQAEMLCHMLYLVVGLLV